jgi:hypothetical protein
MDKSGVANLCYHLKPSIAKQDTKYKFAISIEIRICATLFKPAQGATLSSCSEAFAIGRSNVRLVIREVVFVINTAYRHLI